MVTTTAAATASNIQTCDGYVSAALTRDKTIQFLIQNLVKMGCEPPEGFINCMDCEGKPVSGGFGMLQEESTTPASSEVPQKSTAPKSQTAPGLVKTFWTNFNATRKERPNSPSNPKFTSVPNT